MAAIRYSDRCLDSSDHPINLSLAPSLLAGALHDNAATGQSSINARYFNLFPKGFYALNNDAVEPTHSTMAQAHFRNLLQIYGRNSFNEPLNCISFQWYQYLSAWFSPQFLCGVHHSRFNKACLYILNVAVVLYNVILTDFNRVWLILRELL